MSYANSGMINGHQQTVNKHTQQADNEMGLGTMAVVMSLASLIGLWGFSCLASGLFQSGGIFSLATKWVTAIFGM